jgi:hypothetical protein
VIQFASKSDSLAALGSQRADIAALKGIVPSLGLLDLLIVATFAVL